MQKHISENDLRRILGTHLETNEVIDTRIAKTYEIIRSKKGGKPVRKNNTLRNIIAGVGGAVAVLLLTITFCAFDPTLASEIPILGGFFTKLSDRFSYGQLPEENTVTFYTQDTKVPLYQKTSKDVTVTLTEEYASNQAVFIGVLVENASEFPPMAVFADGTQSLQVYTAETYSFRTDPIISLRTIEGVFENTHTFSGIMRIDYSDINVDDSKYIKAWEEASARGEELWLTDENIAEYLTEYPIPNAFQMKLEITNIIGTLASPEKPNQTTKSKEELEAMTDEEWTAYMASLPPEYDAFPNKYENWYQEGNWSFDLNIAQKDSASRIIEVNEINGDGIGIKSIELSSVEMTLNVVDNVGTIDTVAVVLDANGNKIDNGSSNFYELAIAGHDISTLYIYFCDYDEYMDELKGYALPENHSEKRFQEFLEERALFKTVVDTQN